MKAMAVFLYPGFVTKGLKGILLWHPKRPEFNTQENDWKTDNSVNITDCINDPFPYSDGGQSCVIEVEAA